MAKQTKKYVRIHDYGDLLMPLEVFERVCDQLFIVSTSYEDGEDILDSVKSPTRFHLHDPDEVDNLFMHSKLSNS